MDFYDWVETLPANWDPTNSPISKDDYESDIKDLERAQTYVNERAQHYPEEIKDFLRKSYHTDINVATKNSPEDVNDKYTYQIRIGACCIPRNDYYHKYLPLSEDEKKDIFIIGNYSYMYRQDGNIWIVGLHRNLKQIYVWYHDDDRDIEETSLMMRKYNSWQEFAQDSIHIYNFWTQEFLDIWKEDMLGFYEFVESLQ